MAEIKSRQLALSSATKIRMLSYLFSGFPKCCTPIGGKRICTWQYLRSEQLDGSVVTWQPYKALPSRMTASRFPG